MSAPRKRNARGQAGGFGEAPTATDSSKSTTTGRCAACLVPVKSGREHCNQCLWWIALGVAIDQRTLGAHRSRFVRRPKPEQKIDVDAVYRRIHALERALWNVNRRLQGVERWEAWT